MQPADTPVALIYLRSAASHNDAHLEHQEAICRRYAQERGIQVKEVFIDHSVSGLPQERPSY